MSKLYFSGVVLPERAPLSVSELRSQVVLPSGSLYATLIINVWLNQISVTVESDETDIYALRNLVRSEAEFISNIGGFLMGHGYDIEITKCFGENLVPTQVFGIDIPLLADRAKGRDINSLVNSILPLFFGPEATYLRRCMNDLAFAMKRLDDTAFYCFRALESLRHSFGTDLTEAEQWQELRCAVGATREGMEPLRNRAFPARHGSPIPLTDGERGNLFLYTWDIVEKYIDFRLKSAGVQPVFAQPS